MNEFVAYKVRHAMTRDPVTVRPDTPLSEVGDLFDRHDFNALPVLDGGGQLCGWVTKLDFLEAFAITAQSIIPRYQDVLDRPARTVMRHELVTVEPDLPLTSVLGRMVATRHKSFPVMDGTRLIGIIAREDVIRAVRRAAAGERPDE